MTEFILRMISDTASNNKKQATLRSTEKTKQQVAESRLAMYQESQLRSYNPA
jgi:replicative DNA helicase